MVVSFTDMDVCGFVFGQMTMTGYRKIIALDHDDPERGWHTGDLIVYDLAGKPCARIEPLINGILTKQTSSGAPETFKGGCIYTPQI